MHRSRSRNRTGEGAGGGGGSGSYYELTGTQIGSATGNPNLLIGPTSLDQSCWTKTSITAGTAVADGVPLTEVATTNFHSCDQGVAKAGSSLRYQLKARVKQGLRTRCVLVAYNGANGAYATFDLAGGQIGEAITTYGSGWTAHSASIVAAGSGSYDCTIDFTTDTNAEVFSSVQADAGSGVGSQNNNYAGNASSVAIYVASVVLIPTTSTGRGLSNLIDNDLTTWWDGDDEQSWAGVDVGVGKSVRFTGVRFAPRPGDTGPTRAIAADYEYRVIGAQVQTSNDPAFGSGVSTLDTVPATPFYPRYEMSERAINGTARAARILMPAFAYGSLSELSFVAERTETVTAARPLAPTISPWGGRYPAGSTTVTLTSRTTEAAIYYTTDGSTPTNASTLYTAPFTLTISGSGTTLKAIAYDATLGTATSLVSTSYFKDYGLKPNEDWYDDRGILIEAHSGGMIYADGRYWWFGGSMNKQVPSGAGVDGNLPRMDAGIWLYSSTDLLNWRFDGNVLAMPGNWTALQRPHVIYNASTSKYVLWGHVRFELDDTGDRAVIATADAPAGPWSWVSTSYNPNGLGLKDMNLFVEPDNSAAYLIHVNAAQSALIISRLSSDYLTVDGTYITAISGNREAPVLFKRGSTYFLITSGGNFYGESGVSYDQTYITNTSGPLSAWPDWVTTHVDLFAADPIGTDFDGQSTNVIQIQGETDAWLYVSDHWFNADIYDSRYVFLPLTFASSTAVRAEIPTSWNPATYFP